MIELIAAGLLLIGAAFMLIAAIGMVRFPDLFMRMHAVTKGSAFGAVLMLLAVGLFFGEMWVVYEVVVVITFIFLTAPVASHMIGRAAYFLNVPMWEGTWRDELRDRYDLRQHALKSGLAAAKDNGAASDGVETAGEEGQTRT